MVAAPSRRGGALVLAAYASFVLIGWNAVLLPSLIRSVEADFRQSDAAFGLLYFVSALLYAGGSFSGGFLTERVGRRAVLVASAALLGLGLGGEALAPTWPALLLAALAANWGAGGIDGGVNGLFLDLHSGARGGALNRLHLFFSIGALLAPAALGQFAGAGVSWRPLVLTPGLCALALAALLAAQRVPSGRHVRAAGPARDDTLGRAERALLPFAGLAVGIACYVAAEGSVSSWLVKSLSSVSVPAATGVLSTFWAGLALGRLLSSWVADRFDALVFTLCCIAASSVTLVAAVLTPSFPLAAALYGLTGLGQGPVYPMIMAMGGSIYPRRLAALSGSLAAAAVVGSIIYPPLIGLLAARIGLRAGLVGAGLLGLPMALALVAARGADRRLGRPAARH